MLSSHTFSHLVTGQGGLGASARKRCLSATLSEDGVRERGSGREKEEGKAM